MIRWMLAAAVVLAGSAAQAQTTVDVAKITCEQFILFKVADPEKIGIWLSGFYHGQHNNTVLEPQKLDENGRKVMDFCRGNLKVPVMQAVEKTVGTK